MLGLDGRDVAVDVFFDEAEGAREDFVPPDDPLFDVFMTGRPWLVGYPLHPKLRQVHSLIYPEVQAMILDQKTPEQALNDAATAVDQVLQSP